MQPLVIKVIHASQKGKHEPTICIAEEARPPQRDERRQGGNACRQKHLDSGRLGDMEHCLECFVRLYALFYA